MSTLSKESYIAGMRVGARFLGRSPSGGRVEGTVIRFGLDEATVEFPGFEFLPHLSEVLEDIQIQTEQSSTSASRGVVAAVADTGSSHLCRIRMEGLAPGVLPRDGAWDRGELKDALERLLAEWQVERQLDEDYRAVVARLQSFLASLRGWANGLELALSAAPAGERDEAERRIAETVVEAVTPHLNALFEHFETVAGRIPDSLVGIHSRHVKAQLHPYLLCSPFMWRIFRKPLGYAGDYEMVSMILRDSHEGPSLYARILNRWLLAQVLAEAHRNRVAYLAGRLLNESARKNRLSGGFKVFNLGCGPAREVSQFLGDPRRTGDVEFTLVDFNDETLQVAAASLADPRSSGGRPARLQFVKRSAAQVVRSAGREFASGFDMVYCAGLFDYLADDVSTLLLKAFHGMLAPDGLLLVTNVQLPNPMHGVMTHIFDWHLECRDAADMRRLWQATQLSETPLVSVDETAANVFLEVRKDVD